MSDYEGNPPETMPRFYSATGCLVVTLPRITRVTQGVTQDVTQGVAQAADSAAPRTMDAKMVAYIRTNAKVTTARLAELFNYTSRTIKRHLAKLPNVHYVGHGYSGHWEVCEQGSR